MSETLTCDQCQAAATANRRVYPASGPHGWLSLSGYGLPDQFRDNYRGGRSTYIEQRGDEPPVTVVNEPANDNGAADEHETGRIDLCSVACLRAYVDAHAGELTPAES